MATATLSDVTLVSAPARANSISWVSRVVIFAATCIVGGILWDISWHRTIGRDTFWTPAHLAIYIGGGLSGMTAGWLALRTTFLGTAEEKAAAVRLWGFYAPMGAWVSIWGAIAMLTSAPFDNWWHNAYGLDVKIVSPPHSVLALGMWAVVGGGLLLVLREQNNAPAGEPAPGRWLFVYAAAVLLAMAAVFLLEHSFPNNQHSKDFYMWTAATYPLYLVGVARAAKFRWSATLIGLGYMLIFAAINWILPLFHGEPRLGPVYHRVDHFVPVPFPALLVVPGFAIDLVRNLIGAGRGWLRDWAIVLAGAVVFVAVLALTQWYFSKFLLSPAADNWFFGGNRYWGYTEGDAPYRHEFWNSANSTRHASMTLRAFLIALIPAVISSRIGLWIGNWMAKVRR